MYYLTAFVFALSLPTVLCPRYHLWSPFYLLQVFIQVLPFLVPGYIISSSDAAYLPFEILLSLCYRLNIVALQNLYV